MSPPNLKQCSRRALGVTRPNFNNASRGMADTLRLNGAAEPTMCGPDGKVFGNAKVWLQRTGRDREDGAFVEPLALLMSERHRSFPRSGVRLRTQSPLRKL